MTDSGCKLVVYESNEYIDLLNSFNKLASERIESEKLNKKILQEQKELYEEKIKHLESKLNNWSNFDAEISKNYVDKQTECNLIQDLTMEDINQLASNSKLKLTINKYILNEFKLIKSELLEIDIRRHDLLKSIQDLDVSIQLDNSKSIFQNLFQLNKKQEQIKISNQDLNNLYSKFDSQIVELSNIFLNEKMDLIYKHKQDVEKLNEKLSMHENKLCIDHAIQTDLDCVKIIQTKHFEKGQTAQETQTTLDSHKIASMETTINIFKSLEKIKLKDHIKNINLKSQQTQTNHITTSTGSCQTDLNGHQIIASENTLKIFKNLEKLNLKSNKQDVQSQTEVEDSNVKSETETQTDLDGYRISSLENTLEIYKNLEKIVLKQEKKHSETQTSSKNVYDSTTQTLTFSTIDSINQTDLDAHQILSAENTLQIFKNLEKLDTKQNKQDKQSQTLLINKHSLTTQTLACIKIDSKNQTESILLNPIQTQTELESNQITSYENTLKLYKNLEKFVINNFKKDSESQTEPLKNQINSSSQTNDMDMLKPLKKQYSSQSIVKILNQNATQTDLSCLKVYKQSKLIQTDNSLKTDSESQTKTINCNLKESQTDLDFLKIISMENTLKIYKNLELKNTSGSQTYVSLKQDLELEKKSKNLNNLFDKNEIKMFQRSNLKDKLTQTDKLHKYLVLETKSTQLDNEFKCQIDMTKSLSHQEEEDSIELLKIKYFQTKYKNKQLNKVVYELKHLIAKIYEKFV